MPKNKETTATFNRRIVKEYPQVFRCDDSILFCKMCDIKINAKQLFQVKQHLLTSKHIASVQRKSGNSSETAHQTLITTVQDTNRDAEKYNLDLTKMFLEANIPIYKINCPSVSNFFEKYTKFAVPSETKLRNKCLPQIYDATVLEMKNHAKDEYIWVTIDETTDCEKRFVANFVFGILSENEHGKSYLFSCKELTVTNSTTIAQFFDETIQELGKFELTFYMYSLILLNNIVYS